VRNYIPWAAVASERLAATLVQGALAPSLLNPLPPHLTVLSVLFHYLDLSICDMSNPEPSESFRFLFEIALQRYEEKTGMKLIEHPLAKQLEKCSSVDSITIVPQEQARCFGKFKGDDGKVMKSLKYSINAFHQHCSRRGYWPSTFEGAHHRDCRPLMIIP
jgi:hypothetical protein